MRKGWSQSGGSELSSIVHLSDCYEAVLRHDPFEVYVLEKSSGDKPTHGLGINHFEPYRLFNLDVFEYIPDSPFGIYGSIPFMLSHGKLRLTSGFFWLNAADMQIDVLGEDSGISLPSSGNRIDKFWMSEGGLWTLSSLWALGPRMS
ncbi:hypothetical protein CRG98_047311 [Punica granatum]|uniref:Glycoside hydrolase family 31 N-terminal domain-containing protein n=1 Tax=Punica granatum TaxID=22663 RepID=A0A2I0HKT6_PUNGR|nr:hypothetical protein CRG98_047311 [Punica granatum]